MKNDGELDGKCLQGSSEVRYPEGRRGAEDVLGLEHDGLVRLTFWSNHRVWKPFDIGFKVLRRGVVQGRSKGAHRECGPVGEVEDDATQLATVLSPQSNLNLSVLIQYAF